MSGSRADPVVVPSAAQKKSVCVIGCGASGLAVIKELTALGHSVRCFDENVRIGGVYTKSYDNTMLTTSSLLTAYSDYSDGKEDAPKFWTDEEYLAYLDGFANEFGLYHHIQFRSTIRTVTKDAQTGKWIVATYAFDAVAVCTGTNHWASLPEFPGQEAFLAAGGEIVHSNDYKQAQVYTGKRVLVVGAGESGSDICKEISDTATKVAIAIRDKHGHIIPRTQADGRVTDLNTNRCRYSNPYILGDWVGWANQNAKWLVAKYFASDRPLQERLVLQKIGELNLLQKTSAFSKFGCKNEGFVTAMVTRGAELHRDSFELGAKGATFADGTAFACDAVACTGYRNSFPMFLDPTVRDDVLAPGLLACDVNGLGQNPRLLYKQVFCSKFRTGELAFFGFARPAFGSIPPTAEMQAKLFALVINGDVALPPTADMDRIADADCRNWEGRFGYDGKRVKGLVDFQLYLDDLALQMGALPPLAKLFFSEPRIWWKIMFGPFTTHQYILVGPFADRARALAVYAKQPVGDLLECSITAAFLVCAKVLSLMGFSKFTPNNF
ncbi:flavin-binding monooxygenase-like subfamily [Pelagophyceae sp. CCMP2097]|nr:flavin-binding monooxygenase-like subfamily [Pelagophyceae sp. CCMP2097]